MIIWWLFHSSFLKKHFLDARYHINISNFSIGSICYLKQSQGTLEALHSLIDWSNSSMNGRRICSSCLSTHGNTEHNRINVADWQHREKLGEKNIILAPEIGLDITVNTLFSRKSVMEELLITIFKFLSKHLIQNIQGEISALASVFVYWKRSREQKLNLKALMVWQKWELVLQLTSWSSLEKFPSSNIESWNHEGWKKTF